VELSVWKQALRERYFDCTNMMWWGIIVLSGYVNVNNKNKVSKFFNRMIE
jgi:hypothetical protein